MLLISLHPILTFNLLLLCFRYVCEEYWPTPLYNYYYTIALLVLQFVIPLLVLIFTYTRIAFAVWGKKPPGEAENSRDQRMAKSKRKVCNICNRHLHRTLNKQFFWTIYTIWFWIKPEKKIYEYGMRFTHNLNMKCHRIKSTFL